MPYPELVIRHEETVHVVDDIVVLVLSHDQNFVDNELLGRAGQREARLGVSKMKRALYTAF